MRAQNVIERSGVGGDEESESHANQNEQREGP